MAMKKSSKAKAKPGAASRSAKPAKAAAHKKPAARKTAARKAPVAKHSTKAAPSKKSGGFDDFSGKFTVRLPKSLHQALVDRAEREGVSLNLFVTNALSRTVK